MRRVCLPALEHTLLCLQTAKVREGKQREAWRNSLHPGKGTASVLGASLRSQDDASSLERELAAAQQELATLRWVSSLGAEHMLVCTRGRLGQTAPGSLRGGDVAGSHGLRRGSCSCPCSSLCLQCAVCSVQTLCCLHTRAEHMQAAQLSQCRAVAQAGRV